jgi:hypothetical protein
MLPRAALLPRLYLCLGGDPDQRVVERRQVAIDDDAMAARVPVLDLGPGRRGVSGGQRQHQLRARLLIHLQSEDLTETRNAAAVVQYGIAADLKLQAVQGSLEGEAAPVDRGGEREDGRLDFPARRTETV